MSGFVPKAPTLSPISRYPIVPEKEVRKRWRELKKDGWVLTLSQVNYIMNFADPDEHLRLERRTEEEQKEHTRCKRIARSMKGKKNRQGTEQSAEARKKISEGQKAAWALRKALKAK